MFPYLHFRVRPAGRRQKSRSWRGHEETVLHQPEGGRRQWADPASRGSPGQCCYWRPEGKEGRPGGPRDHRQDRTGRENPRCWAVCAAPSTRLMWNWKGLPKHPRTLFPSGLTVLLWSMWLQIHGAPLLLVDSQSIIDWVLESSIFNSLFGQHHKKNPHKIFFFIDYYIRFPELP